MDAGGHVRAGQREDVVVALLVVRQAQRSGKIGFGQLQLLDLGAEAAVVHQDALGRFGKEADAGGGGGKGSHAARSFTGPERGRRPRRWQMA